MKESWNSGLDVGGHEFNIESNKHINNYDLMEGKVYDQMEVQFSFILILCQLRYLITIDRMVILYMKRHVPHILDDYYCLYSRYFLMIFIIF